MFLGYNVNSLNDTEENTKTLFTFAGIASLFIKTEKVPAIG